MKTDLYPLLLRPQFHPRVWGAQNLAPVYDVEFSEPVGEAWLTGEQCQVLNGSLAGHTLAELVRDYGTELIGSGYDSSRFPLLIKLLFPHDKLSVQVHPDDEGARRKGQPCGKTECWYVWKAEPGAKIGLGLRSGISKAELKRAIKEKRMETLLNWIEARRGDMFYVDAGTVHAIGPGLILVETQQNSDATYRLYDYGRTRELHIEDGLAAVKEQTHAGKVPARMPRMDAGNIQRNLLTAPCFIVDQLRFVRRSRFERESPAKAKVLCLIAIEGAGQIEFGQMAPIKVCTGHAVIVPAAVQQFWLRPESELELLCAWAPESSATINENRQKSPFVP